jgi:hypothetical protein
MTNLYPVSKRRPKDPSEKHKPQTITMHPLKLNKHKEFSKSIGESLSEFYRVAADMRMKKEKIKFKQNINTQLVQTQQTGLIWPN